MEPSWRSYEKEVRVNSMRGYLAKLLGLKAIEMTDGGPAKRAPTMFLRRHKERKGAHRMGQFAKALRRRRRMNQIAAASRRRNWAV
jgi:hypothetical protein